MTAFAVAALLAACVATRNWRLRPALTAITAAGFLAFTVGHWLGLPQ